VAHPVIVSAVVQVRSTQRFLNDSTMAVDFQETLVWLGGLRRNSITQKWRARGQCRQKRVDVRNRLGLPQPRGNEYLLRRNIKNENPNACLAATKFMSLMFVTFKSCQHPSVAGRIATLIRGVYGAL
jgi:hypothetical protein